MEIDLNCDLGEGCGLDAELMPLITSANIACGAHAGDPQTMMATLGDAKRYGVRVGAHPGFFDRGHFGRRELRRSEEEVFEDCVYQIGALRAMAQAIGSEVRYVKAHGALYNLACREQAYARPVVRAAQQFQLAIMGLPNSVLAQEAQRAGAGFLAEGFADRRYQPDGLLAPRSEPGAYVTDPQEAVRQAEWLIRERGVQTLCVHGDNPHALAFVRTLRADLRDRGFVIQSSEPRP